MKTKTALQSLFASVVALGAVGYVTFIEPEKNIKIDLDKIDIASAFLKSTLPMDDNQNPILVLMANNRPVTVKALHIGNTVPVDFQTPTLPQHLKESDLARICTQNGQRVLCNSPTITPKVSCTSGHYFVHYRRWLPLVPNSYTFYQTDCRLENS